MGQVLTLPQMLKEKITALKSDDYTKERIFDEEELGWLSTVTNDEQAELDDRILASRTLVNIAENRLIRAQRSVAKFKAQWSALEHRKQEDRNITNTTNEVLKKLGNVEGIDKVLEELLAMTRAKKER